MVNFGSAEKVCDVKIYVELKALVYSSHLPGNSSNNTHRIYHSIENWPYLIIVYVYKILIGSAVAMVEVIDYQGLCMTEVEPA